MERNKNWEEILKIQKQREEKYTKLVEVGEVNGEWFIVCKKHNKNIILFEPFATNSLYEKIDKGLENC